MTYNLANSAMPHIGELLIPFRGKCFLLRENPFPQLKTATKKSFTTMTTPKTNGNGAKEVTPATTNKTNGKTTTTGDNKPKAEEKPAATVTPKAEEKAAPVVAETPTEQPPKPKTLDEQLQFFLGLERLVNIRRRFEHHLEAVNELTIEDEELTKFETNNRHGIRIELYDSEGNSYSMTNPRLVKEMHAHLVSVLQGKIDDCNGEILTYGETA